MGILEATKTPIPLDLSKLGVPGIAGVPGIVPSAEGILGTIHFKEGFPEKDKEPKPAEPHARVLPLTMEQQQQKRWCWAAVTQSVGTYYEPDTTFTQCEIAIDQKKRSDCCSDPQAASDKNRCNDDDVLGEPLDRIGHLVNIEGVVTFERVKAQIKQGLPLAWRIQWSNGGGHFAVIEGYTNAGFCHIEDPAYGPSWYSYDDLKEDYQGSKVGAWSHSYFTKS